MQKILLRLALSALVAGSVAAAIAYASSPQPTKGRPSAAGQSDSPSARDVAAIKSVIAQGENTYLAMDSPLVAEGSDHPFADDASHPGPARVDSTGKHGFIAPDELERTKATGRSELAKAFTGHALDTLVAQQARVVDGMANGGGVIQTAGGATLKSLDSLNVAGDTATATATIHHWDIVGQLDGDTGEIRYAKPEADIIVHLTLTRDSTSGWLVSDRTWDFAPGSEP